MIQRIELICKLLRKIVKKLINDFHYYSLKQRRIDKLAIFEKNI
jgi:hypothetical protein